MAGKGSKKQNPQPRKRQCPTPSSTISGTRSEDVAASFGDCDDSDGSASMMTTPTLTARAFARMPLAVSDDLQPIRRPLPSVSSNDSESETSSAPSTPPAKRRNMDDPFYHPDLSDSDMSPGLSPTPSPEPNNPRSNITTLACINNRTSNNSEFIDILPKYTPPRRGDVPADGDFDFLMHFCYKAPELKDEDKTSKKRKRGEKKKKRKPKEERPEPALNCYSTTETALMSWSNPAGAMILRRPGEGNAALGNGEDGSARGAAMGEGGSANGAQSTGTGGTMGGGSTGGDGTLGGEPSDGLGNMASVGGSAAGGSGDKKGNKIAKRLNRRARSQPKRTYTWADADKKNRSGKRDGTRSGKDAKGKGKEM